jgi:hypothetical protein
VAGEVGQRRPGQAGEQLDGRELGQTDALVGVGGDGGSAQGALARLRAHIARIDPDPACISYLALSAWLR